MMSRTENRVETQLAEHLPGRLKDGLAVGRLGQLALAREWI